MGWNGWVAVALGFILGAWLTFDGTRAFVVGDYVTPASGANAGKLGPWSKVVAAAGLDPRSPAIRGLHVGLGVLWLVAVGCFIARVGGSHGLIGLCAVASLWYLPMGTLIGIVELALVVLPAVMRAPTS